MQKADFNTLADFLRSSEREHRQRSLSLAADSRGDEAGFEKIRANVFGIFAAVLETARKVHGDGDASAAFFGQKLRDIPGAWRVSLAAAREKGDRENALVEKLKLESVSEIEKAFAAAKGEGK